MPPLRRILLTRTDRIGDVILSLPAAHAIKASIPDAQVTFLVSEPVAPVVRMCPWVDVCLTTKAGETTRALAARLEAGSFDAAVCLYPRFGVARALRAARIPLRAGTSRRWYSTLFNRRIPVSRAQGTLHESEYNILLLSALEIAPRPVARPLCLPPDDAVHHARIILGECKISPGTDPFVVIHPGCGGSARNWAWQRYRELAGRLAEGGTRIVITGSAPEARIAGEIAENLGPSVSVIAGRTDLPTLAAILKEAAVFVGPSTGPIHLAAAVGTPVVALFGPVRTTGPERWGPLGEAHTVFVPPVPPCNCNVNRCERGDCMDLITVEEVANAVGRVLAPTKARDGLRNRQDERQ